LDTKGNFGEKLFQSDRFTEIKVDTKDWKKNLILMDLFVAVVNKKICLV